MDIRTQNARNTDPESIHLAGEEITNSGQRQRQIDLVSAVVRDMPGRTSRELAAITHLDRYMLARRLPDCASVRKGDMRKCVVSQKQAVTWWPK